jgi:hypothetical protein
MSIRKIVAVISITLLFAIALFIYSSSTQYARSVDNKAIANFWPLPPPTTPTV